MLVRRKTNRSGSISVHVVDKSGGGYKVIKTFGTASTAYEADLLENKARQYIRERTGQLESLFGDPSEDVLNEFLAGLLVTTGGNPIGYEIYEGNIFEGHALIPVIEKLASAHGLSHPIVIADAGLPSKDNVRNLEEQGYKYILGARPKNESGAIRAKILGLHMKDGDVFVIDKAKGVKLVVSKTEKRAVKDARNREKGLARLEKKVAKGRLTKSSINNRGYNTYLKMEGDVTISIGMDKFNADAAWDGIKAYMTNTTLNKEEVIANYGNLWYIERAFRMNKSDLRVRPICHRLRNRIEGHICICFNAYAVLLELERILKATGSPLTLARVREAVKTMCRLNYVSPNTRKPMSVLLQMDAEQKQVYDLIYPPE